MCSTNQSLLQHQPRDETSKGIADVIAVTTVLHIRLKNIAENHDIRRDDQQRMENMPNCPKGMGSISLP